MVNWTLQKVGRTKVKREKEEISKSRRNNKILYYKSSGLTGLFACQLNTKDKMVHLQMLYSQLEDLQVVPACISLVTRGHSDKDVWHLHSVSKDLFRS